MISAIAVGTDGSGTATEAVGMAADLARRFGAKLVLVSAFQAKGEPVDRSGASVELQWATSPSARVPPHTRPVPPLPRQLPSCATRCTPESTRTERSLNATHEHILVHGAFAESEREGESLGRSH